MITCVIALKVAEQFEPESAFTRQLVRAGERLKKGMDMGLLDGLAVWHVMDEDFVALPVCRQDAAGARIVGICEKEAIVEMHDRQAFTRIDRTPRA